LAEDAEAEAAATDGGASGSDSGVEDASTQDATDATVPPLDATSDGTDAGDATAIDAGGSVDAPGDTADATGACSLPTLPSTPFVPLSGSATLSGTVGAIGTQVVPPGCVLLVTNPIHGVLTFSFASSSCSFTYTDASGSAYSSTLGAGTGFNGDTYSCSENPAVGGAAADKNSLCPELSTVSNGVIIKIGLTVTRSTGTVALTRDCEYEGTTCGGTGGFVDTRTTEFSLGGGLECTNGG
jgi:hypothetical protein